MFSQNPGNLVNGPIFINAYGPIFSTDQGTFMTVHTSAVDLPPVNIFQLPGTLPCIDCYGSPQGIGPGTGGTVTADPTTGMVLLPNPAQHEVHIRFNDPGVRVDHVVLMDATGREVSRAAVGDPRSITLSVAGLANGWYVVTAFRGDRPIGSLPLQVAR